MLLEQVEELERVAAVPQVQVDARSSWEPHQDQTQPHEQAEVTPVEVKAAVENLAQPHGPEVRINGSLRARTRGKMRTWRLPRETSICGNITASRRRSTWTSSSSWRGSGRAWPRDCSICCCCQSDSLRSGSASGRSSAASSLRAGWR